MEASDKKTTVSQGGSHNAYHVEVKSNVNHPVRLEEVWYGSEWKWFHPKQSCLPPSQIYSLDHHFELLTYEAAMALAWMVMAVAQSYVDPKSFGIAVRVISSKVTYHYEAVRDKEFPNIPWRGHGNEDP